MRKFLLIFFALAILGGCKSKTGTEKTKAATSSASIETTEKSAPASSPVPAPGPLDKLLGSFVGPFGDNKITMLITKVAGDSIAGRTIVGGNDRPFRGTFSKKEDRYEFFAKEPGDDKYDGEFSFFISETNPSEVTGTWKPYAKGKPSKEYTLTRKAFAYRTDVGDYPEASQRLLKAADVENLMKEDLEYTRNEIFARHGFCFNKKNLRQQFEMQEWYVPNTVNIKGFLTDIEKKNIELIKRYEKYAEEYGDEYGR